MQWYSSEQVSRAMLVLLVQGTFSAVVGDWFPFTQVPMYANLAGEGDGRRVAAVPIVLVDGKLVSIDHFEAFRGNDPSDIEPWQRCRELTGDCSAYPSSDPRDFVIAEWIRRHPSAPERVEGPVTVEVAYALLTSQGDGTYAERREVVWRGKAWPRRP